MKFSPEAKRWVEGRNEAIKLKVGFEKDGGHIMLKKEVYRKDLLPETLRLEVEAYDKWRRKNRLDEINTFLKSSANAAEKERAIKEKGLLLYDDDTVWWFRRPEIKNSDDI